MVVSGAQIVTRLLVAAVFGGLVGIERERYNQPAGFRTHIILCVGSCLMMMLSIFVALDIGNPARSADPGRIAAQVVSGIGFLGAGAILRFGVSVKGLTTAASLWTIAGIGLAVGSGFYLGAAIATVLMVLALSMLKKLERFFLAGRYEQNLVLAVRDVPGVIGLVEAALGKHKVSIVSVRMEKSSFTRMIELQAIIKKPKQVKIPDITAELSSIPEVSEVEIQ
jgi:putative Mg2+ transporter-C (MgtC) family protein